ncbi:hypothetical protein [Lihuaxuella thermophila]|uniref:Uncharacterized protein n=1 Tax=Lihuaxuella thermophila TaxID=1173111 RepID=A0A1H8DIV3_9BACL|nr:hypothetical protein [Lihuaxuella thermophila]SEN07209.1 hypothetical protein SAMN05444955_105207 [Lihuaxuella thermophila]
MAIYYGKYEMNESQTANAMTWLKPGDEVHLVSRLGKNMKFTVKQTFEYKDKIVYVTDHFGIVYANELRKVPRPAWKNQPSAPSAAVVNS